MRRQQGTIVATVQTRLLFLLIVLVGILLCGMIVLHHSETDRAKSILVDQETSEQKLLHKIIELNGTSLVTLAYDYSFWDDMVTFVKTSDSGWAHENIDVGIETYDATAAWVFRTDMAQVYAVCKVAGEVVAMEPFLTANSEHLFANGMFPHFFVSTPLGPMEMCGAPIQPSADEGRSTPPVGYLLVGRLWSSDYVRELERLSEANITLVEIGNSPLTQWMSDLHEAQVRTADTLYGWNSFPVTVVRSESRSGFLAEYNRAVNTRTAVIIVFCSLLILVGWYTLRFWVSRPLASISRALSEDDAKYIQNLKMEGGEFGLIAYLIDQFFHQNSSLVDEIVERKHTEEALKDAATKVSELAAEQRVLLENTSDFIYRHDTQGIFHYVSHSVEAVTGYTPQEWMRHYTSYLTDSPANAKVIDFTERAMEEGITFPPYQVEIYHKQKHRLVLEVNEQPYYERGKVAGIVGVARDITLRLHEAEQQEILQRRLEKAERAESLALLAGGVAHDLNNILGPLVAYPELIMMKLPSDSPHRRQLEIMSKAARDAADVIQDLLALARRGRYETKPTDVNEVLRQYLESPNFLSLRENHPNISVNVALPDTLPNISGSASHLMKAIMNLVVNAFEAIGDRGELTIRTYSGQYTQLPSGFNGIEPGEYVVVSVKDSGVGINPEDVYKIFHPYYSSKPMGASGSGLGLAVVHGIVKDHKGYYDVLSEPGRGAEFLLFFPATSAPIMTSCPAEQKNYEPGPTPVKILVVEDDSEQREIARQILGSLGYEVELVTNGHEAVVYLSGRSVDLVLLDMILEKDFDGLDTYEAILKIHPQQRAILVSGYATTDRVSKLQTLGVTAFVRKPYSRRELAEAINTELLRNAGQRADQEHPVL